MSLGKKIALFFVLLGCSIAVACYTSMSLTILPAFEQFETDTVRETIARVDHVFESEARTFETVNREYAHWDDAYSFALGQNDQFIEKNLSLDYWKSIGVDLILIYDINGALVWGAYTDATLGSVDELNAHLYEPIDLDHPLFARESWNAPVSGVLRTRDGLMLVASDPILTTYGEGPAVGSFIIAKYINDPLLDDIAARASADLKLLPVTDNGAAGFSLATLQRMVSDDDQRRVDRRDGTLIGHRLMLDISQAPAAMLEVRMPPLITEAGQKAIATALIFIAAITTVFLLVAIAFMRRLVVAPVNELAQSMQHIGTTGDLDVPVQKMRNDEIGRLAREFDQMTTSLHLAQRELEATRDVAIEASRAKSDFLARMSHEIRTPMNGVLGMTELLRNTPLTFDQQRFADTIYSSAGNLLDIINDILDFSKIEAGKMQLELRDIDLGAVIEETVDSLASQAHQKGLELINDVSPAVHSTLQGDPVRIRQVLTNLVANAIKFTNEGEVVVRASAANANEAGIDVHIEVIDTGVGIRPEMQQLIFDSFAQEDGSTTRLYGGTGLGLAISKQLVELMGGELGVDSTPGVGSRFYFTVRAQRSDVPAAPLLNMGGNVAGRHILVVDDNATNREILEHHLAGWRAECGSASCAEEALELLEECARRGEPYDLVVLDMHMPRIDGVQLARRIRAQQEYDDVRLIILSSVALPASEQVLEELRIAGQLTKPIRQSQLYNSLSVVLGDDAPALRYASSGETTARALRGRVLLAEDNPVNQAVALGMLDAIGVDAAVVTDGQAAIEASTDEAFDLVLMDCQMPVVDGLEATRKIRAREQALDLKRVAIIALTANALAGDRERCLEAGMDDYLGKPFTTDQLHAVLSMYLRAAEAESPADTTETRDETGVPSTGESSETGDPLDRSALDVLSTLQQPGAPSLVDKVVRIYLDSSRGIKERLVGAIGGNDPGGIREAAHALKSSSINVGATRLAELCKRLETGARENDLGDLHHLQARLEREYVRVVDALRMELEAIAG